MAFQYAQAASGLCTAADYPAGGSGACQAAKCPHRCRVKSFVSVPSSDKGAFLAALAGQPLAVGVEASSPPFQMYTGGVITGTACGSMVSHGSNIACGARRCVGAFVPASVRAVCVSRASST